MTDHRGPPHVPPNYFQPGNPGYQRVMQRIDDGLGAVSDRMESALDRIDNRLERMERDIARGEVDRASQSREIDEVRRDLGEVRDAISMAEGKRVEKAAEGAAKGAAAGVKATESSIWKTRWGAAVAFAIGFVALVTFIEKVPRVARWIDSAWVYVRDPHATRVAPAETPNKAGAGNG